MSAEQPLRVLLVVGDPAFTAQLRPTLAHSGLVIETAETEQSIVAALTSGAFGLILVGGQVGRRGPLVLCDAVRIRQTEAQVLVLVREETDEASWKDHLARQLPRVHYLDLRGVASPVDRLQLVRSDALRIGSVAEEPASVPDWPALVAKVAAAASATDESSVREGASGADGAGQSGGAASIASGASDGDGADDQGMDGGREGGEAGAGMPVIAEALTDDDYAFAGRMLARTRGVDFRAALLPSPVPEGTDRAVGKLRDRVRELEHNLARLAHVYGGRCREFDAAAAQLTELESVRNALTQERERARLAGAEQQAQLESLASRRADVEARLQATADELGRAREEAKAKEASFTSLLKQAQDAFVQLREQSTQAAAYYEKRIADQDRQLQEVGELRGSGQHANNKIAELTAQASELQAHVASYKGALEAAEARHAEEQARWQQLRGTAVADLEQETVRVRADAEGRAAQLLERDREVAGLKGEIEQCGREITRLTESERALRLELEAASNGLTESGRQVGVLSAQMQEKEREIHKLGEDQRMLREETERSRSRALEQAFDARLQALEELLRLASDGVTRQATALAALERDANEQTPLLAELARAVEHGATRKAAARGPAASRAAAGGRGVGHGGEGEDEGGDSGPAGMAATWRGLRRRLPPVFDAQPWLLPVVGGLLLSFLVVVVVALARGGSSARPAVVSPLPAASNVPAQAAGAAEAQAPAASPASPPEAVASEVKTAEAAPTEAAPAEAQAAPAAAGDSAAALAAAAAVPPSTERLDADGRKKVRRQLFDAYKNKRWDEAARAGYHMRAGSSMDWEAQYNLAHALRQSGRVNEAIEMYHAFITEFPDNKFLKDAKAYITKLEAKR